MAYDEKLTFEICERIANGEPLRQICRDEHMPGWTTVYNWLKENPEFAERFARARDLGADCIAESILDIVDEPPAMTADGKLDPAHVKWQNMRADMRLKLLAKWNPRKYGDKQEIAMSGGLKTEVRIVSEFDGDDLV